MNQLHVRCPSCAKLYQVDVSTIFSTSPHFQCVGCPTRFSFDFPPVDAQNVQTYSLKDVRPASIVPAMKSCPRCGEDNPKTSKECLSCHVLFERVEGLPKDPQLKAQPSLVRQWKELVGDFTNEDRHQAFLMNCRELGALNFARANYVEIRDLQGQDEISEAMLLRIEALAHVEPPPPPVPPKPATVLQKTAGFFPRWKKYLLIAPFITSFLMVTWGLMHHGPRNMIGVGIAVGLLSYGLLSMTRKAA